MQFKNLRQVYWPQTWLQFGILDDLKNITFYVSMLLQSQDEYFLI